MLTITLSSIAGLFLRPDSTDVVPVPPPITTTFFLIIHLIQC
jgi:hypothetical protein